MGGIGRAARLEGGDGMNRRMPAHLRELAADGITPERLAEVRGRLRAVGIELVHNTRGRVWIASGWGDSAQHITLKLGHGAVLDYLRDPDSLIRDFESQRRFFARLADDVTQAIAQGPAGGGE